MKINLTDKYTLRNGWEAEVGWLDCGGPYPVLGRMRSNHSSVWASARWTEDGINGPHGDHDFDLVPAPVTLSAWVNISREHCGRIIASIYLDEEKSKGLIVPYLTIARKRVEITYTPGEGL